MSDLNVLNSNQTSYCITVMSDESDNPHYIATTDYVFPRKLQLTDNQHTAIYFHEGIIKDLEAKVMLLQISNGFMQHVLDSDK